MSDERVTKIARREPPPKANEAGDFASVPLGTRSRPETDEDALAKAAQARAFDRGAQATHTQPAVTVIRLSAERVYTPFPFFLFFVQFHCVASHRMTDVARSNEERSA
jgi:hypothetical protein